MVIDAGEGTLAWITVKSCVWYLIEPLCLSALEYTYLGMNSAEDGLRARANVPVSNTHLGSPLAHMTCEWGREGKQGSSSIQPGRGRINRNFRHVHVRLPQLRTVGLGARAIECDIIPWIR